MQVRRRPHALPARQEAKAGHSPEEWRATLSSSRRIPEGIAAYGLPYEPVDQRCLAGGCEKVPRRPGHRGEGPSKTD